MPGHPDAFVFCPNTLRLDLRQGALALACLLLAAVVLPRAWRAVEPFAPAADYRVPYEYVGDYWQVARWAGQAPGALVLGDSVVWGEYCTPDETLPAQLGRLAGGAGFANLGLNGLSPAALGGFLDSCASGLSGRKVLVVFNPLWLSSEAADLRSPPSEEEVDRGFTINHAELMPQFWPATPRLVEPPEPDRAAHGWLDWRRWTMESGHLATLAARLEDRLGNVLRRNLGVLQLAGHLRNKARLRAGTDELARQHPDLLTALADPVPAPAAVAHSRPLPWYENGLIEGTLAFAWPQPAASFQWGRLLAALAGLRQQGNQVLVVITPFNPYLQTSESRAAYERFAAAALAALAAAGVPALAPASLPSEEYADGSHPLAAGYRRLASALWSQPVFQAWWKG